MYEVSPAAYIFTHTYLNTMQQGIQSLHVVGELFVSTLDSNILSEKVYGWASDHKTVIILNAGGGEGFDISLDHARIFAIKYHMPFATFQEPDIHDMTTAFGFIMTPELAFEINEFQMVNKKIVMDTEEAHILASFLSKFPSAR